MGALRIKQIYQTIGMTLGQADPRGNKIDRATVSPILNDAYDDFLHTLPQEAELESLVSDRVSKKEVALEYAQFTTILQKAKDALADFTKTGQPYELPSDQSTALCVFTIRLNSALKNLLPALTKLVDVDAANAALNDSVAAFLKLSDAIDAVVNDAQFTQTVSTFVNNNGQAAWEQLQLHVQQTYNFMSLAIATLKQRSKRD